MGRIVVANADDLGAVDRRQGADQVGTAGARADHRHADRRRLSGGGSGQQRRERQARPKRPKMCGEPIQSCDRNQPLEMRCCRRAIDPGHVQFSFAGVRWRTAWEKGEVPFCFAGPPRKILPGPAAAHGQECRRQSLGRAPVGASTTTAWPPARGRPVCGSTISETAWPGRAVAEQDRLRSTNSRRPTGGGSGQSGRMAQIDRPAHARGRPTARMELLPALSRALATP